MPEIRRNPFVNNWVILSESRKNRPNAFLDEKSNLRPEQCPFCPGNEAMTPESVFELVGERSGEKRWIARVVPNKYPAVDYSNAVTAFLENEFYTKIKAVGVHEVIVETNNHFKNFYTFNINDFKNIFKIYQNRITEIGLNKSIKHIQIIKNHGSGSGASIEHSHSQVLATEMLPNEIAEKHHQAKMYFEKTSRCLFCSFIQDELKSGERLVLRQNGYVVIEAYAPRFAYETWIFPENHSSRFEEFGDDEIVGFSEIVFRTMSAFNQTMKGIGFNFILQNAPVNMDGDYYHWHVEILPMLSKMAGYERATGFYLNPVFPEEAAIKLRAVI